MEKRLDLARSRGCDAVEPDNVDAFDNKNGLGLHRGDQLQYNKWLAHSRLLAAVATSSANGLVGSGFATGYQLQPRAGF